jgi:hypothetical protein
MDYSISLLAIFTHVDFGFLKFLYQLLRLLETSLLTLLVNSLPAVSRLSLELHVSVLGVFICSRRLWLCLLEVPELVHILIMVDQLFFFGFVLLFESEELFFKFIYLLDQLNVFLGQFSIALLFFVVAGFYVP